MRFALSSNELKQANSLGLPAVEIKASDAAPPISLSISRCPESQVFVFQALRPNPRPSWPLL